MEVGSVVNDPRLYYRLDPGELGLLQSAPASQSRLRVVAQELHNLQRFKMEALQEGYEKGRYGPCTDRTNCGAAEPSSGVR